MGNHQDHQVRDMDPIVLGLGEAGEAVDVNVYVRYETN